MIKLIVRYQRLHPLLFNGLGVYESIRMDLDRSDLCQDRFSRKGMRLPYINPSAAEGEIFTNGFRTEGCLFSANLAGNEGL
jgi:hypothetical protein